MTKISLTPLKQSLEFADYKTSAMSLINTTRMGLVNVYFINILDIFEIVCLLTQSS